MNPLALLQVPWRSSHRSLRWFAAVVFVACSIGAMAIGMFATKPDRWIVAVVVYASGLIYLWAFLLSTCLLLAIDTRQLRVPGVQRQIALSLLLYGALLVILPAGVLAWFGLPAWNAATMLALASVCGLLFVLLPRFVAVFCGLIPSLLSTLWRRLDLPGLADPHFAPWAGLVLLLMLVAVILRWRQLLLAGPNLATGWSSPMVIQFRHGSWGHWNTIGDSRMLRQRPDWLRPVLDLDHAGPENPSHALRVALGGWYPPQTWSSRIKHGLLGLSLVALPLLGSLLLARAQHAGALVQVDSHAGDAMKAAIVGGFSTLSVFAGPMVSLLTTLWISRRWQRTNAELPLLALLPGLGNPAHAKQSLLRAALGTPLILHALLVLLVIVAMLCWRGHAQLLSFMLLAQLGTATLTAAMVLNVFGGRALRTPAISLLILAAFVLTTLSLLLPMVAQGMAQGEPLLTWSGSLLVLAWLLFGASMAWLGRRGWRALMQSPHPYLPN